MGNPKDFFILKKIIIFTFLINNGYRGHFACGIAAKFIKGHSLCGFRSHATTHKTPPKLAKLMRLFSQGFPSFPRHKSTISENYLMESRFENTIRNTIRGIFGK